MLNIAAEHVKRSPLPLHFVRFNPDAWSKESKAQTLPLGQRHLAMLREILMPVEGFTITYLFYDAQDGL
eukprot:1991296-Alexandrium_andersonii.AAC.1